MPVPVSVNELRAAIPRPIRAGAQRAIEIALAKVGRWRVRCPICHWRFREFRSAGLARRANARCPRCGSLERHRLQWLFFRHRTNLFTGPGRVLHFAPEPCFEPRLRAIPGIHYVTADIVEPDVAVRLDITRIPFADDSFDVILCSHVLEHVPDDGAAMAELFRVLRPGGWALLQVPIDASRERTFEDPNVVDPAEREELFGQADHVRVYGRDYGERLEAAGFEVRVDDFAGGLDERLVTMHALVREPLYLCRKG